MAEKRIDKYSGSTLSSMGSITVTLTAGLMLDLSPAVASAYVSAPDPIVQMEILRGALADGTAVPSSTVAPNVDIATNGYHDSTPPSRRKKRKRDGI